VCLCLFQTKSYLQKNAVSEVTEQCENAALSEMKVCHRTQSDHQKLPASCCVSSDRPDANDSENLVNGAWASSPESASCLPNNLFTPVTLFVNSRTSLSELVSVRYGSSSAECLMLTGLHTCGNLSADILRLFVATPSAHVLCQLGCCYNLLSERFLHFPGVPDHGNFFAALHCIALYL